MRDPKKFGFLILKNMFGKIKRMTKSVRTSNVLLSWNETKIMEFVLSDSNLQEKIIELNQKQLQEGKQADGSPTGEYSEGSVLYYGRTPGVITLKDTGAFYASMGFVPVTEGFKIKADTLKVVQHGKQKGYTVDLLQRWNKAIGISEESLREIRPYILMRLRIEIRKKIFG